jgi:acetyltransferase-like isoleucine patch superfamily enzyme
LLADILTRLRLRMVKGVRISGGVKIRGIGNISFGRRVAIDRYCIINATRGRLSLDDGVTLAPFVVIETREGFVEIGAGSSINSFSTLHGHGGLKIGRDCIIAGGATFIPANHVYEDPGRLIKAQGETRRGIIVEDDVWIASKVTVLDGVTIGRGAVIGAGSVVTKDVPPYSVAVGVPAQVVKLRGKPHD